MENRANRPNRGCTHLDGKPSPHCPPQTCPPSVRKSYVYATALVYFPNVHGERHRGQQQVAGRRGAHGHAERPLADAAGALAEGRLPNFVAPGPRTAQWRAEHIARKGHSFEARRELF